MIGALIIQYARIKLTADTLYTCTVADDKGGDVVDNNKSQNKEKTSFLSQQLLLQFQTWYLLQDYLYMCVIAQPLRCSQDWFQSYNSGLDGCRFLHHFHL